jgi:hypothetical protein
MSKNHHDSDRFAHRILQCKKKLRRIYIYFFLQDSIQCCRIGLASFDWNYFDEHRLVLLDGKEYFDYVIPSRSTIVIIILKKIVFVTFSSSSRIHLVMVFCRVW